MKFNYVSGRRCLDFAGTMRHRGTSRAEELLTSPQRLSDWALQAGLVDATIEITDDELAAAIALREAIYRIVAARLDQGRSKVADVDLLNERASQPQLTPRLHRGRIGQPRGHRIATARLPGRRSARPVGGTRHREGQALFPPELHAPLHRLVTGPEPALVRDEHLRQPRQGASLPRPPACRRRRLARQLTQRRWRAGIPQSFGACTPYRSSVRDSRGSQTLWA